MRFTRRRALQVGGVTAVAAAIPAVQHIAWNGRDFDREGYEPQVTGSQDGETLWANWSGIETARPEAIATPATEEELVSLIAGGTGPLRPVGSGHSFTGLVPSAGTLIDVSQLSGIALDPDDETSIIAGAGARLQHVGRTSDEFGLAFENMPDVDVQTLAGAFATGTHGTGKNLRAIHSYVSAMRLVTPAGEIIELSEDRDADMLNAARVSLGALGVVSQYRLQLVEAYSLRRRVWIEAAESLLDRLDSLADEHRNFEAYMLPNTGQAVGISHDLDSGQSVRIESEGDDDFLLGLKQLRDQFGWWSWLRRRLAAANITPGVYEDRTDSSRRLLATSRPIKFNESEYHLPLDSGVAAAREIIATLDSRADAYFPMEIRYTAPDEAWLSPFNGGGRISIAVHTPAAESYEMLTSVIEPIFRRHGGRPHWGKLHSLGAAELAELYPRFGDFQDLQRELDPDGRMLNQHLRHLLGAGSHA